LDEVVQGRMKAAVPTLNRRRGFQELGPRSLRSNEQGQKPDEGSGFGAQTASV
jgi:hypothetical protein